MGFFDLLSKDIKFENESKKVIVALRVLYLIVLIAFVADVILAGPALFQAGWVGIALLFAALIILLISTYYTRTRAASRLFMLYIFLWTLFMIPRIGWSAGMQNYFILILLVVFFGNYGRLALKLVYCSIVLAVRIGVILYYGGIKPLSDISWLTDKLMQITNISAVFVAIIFMSYYFTKTENEAENKLVKYNEHLQKEANTDQLTGLYNRRKAMEYLEELMQPDSTQMLSVAMGDIDFFKKVNDNYGHDAGDEVLKEISVLMKDTLRGDSFIARWGGEEFLILFPDTNGDQAQVGLERLRRTIEQHVITVGDQDIRITMTFGLAEYDFVSSAEDTLKEADEKLYSGKQNGRNQVVY